MSRDNENKMSKLYLIINLILTIVIVIGGWLFDLAMPISNALTVVSLMIMAFLVAANID